MLRPAAAAAAAAEGGGRVAGWRHCGSLASLAGSWPPRRLPRRNLELNCEMHATRLRRARRVSGRAASLSHSVCFGTERNADGVAAFVTSTTPYCVTLYVVWLRNQLRVFSEEPHTRHDTRNERKSDNLCARPPGPCEISNSRAREREISRCVCAVYVLHTHDDMGMVPTVWGINAKKGDKQV